jgi:hypothetical protein
MANNLVRHGDCDRLQPSDHPTSSVHPYFVRDADASSDAGRPQSSISAVSITYANHVPLEHIIHGKIGASRLLCRHANQDSNLG